jgi:hypothetical protein
MEADLRLVRNVDFVFYLLLEFGGPLAFLSPVHIGFLKVQIVKGFINKMPQTEKINFSQFTIEKLRKFEHQLHFRHWFFILTKCLKVGCKGFLSKSLLE